MGVARRALGWLERAAFPEAKEAGEQWQRLVMNRSVDAYLRRLGPQRLRAAEISGANHGGLPWREHVSLEHPAFDVCAPVEEPGRFDVVICEQVLEHVPDPWGAARNLHELCAPGGHVIVSTPFLIKLHELGVYDMRDYWRFTPRGLRTLLEQAGLELEAVESWGNRQCVTANLSRWTAYRRWHSLADNPDTPVQVWAFARRPA